jgi:DNA-directed RNA polymerase subunit beta'
MLAAGVKPGWVQYKQMVLAPMLVRDSADRLIPTPVKKSYAEGLDLAGYWTQLHGARRGAVLKVQEVSEPGAISKLLMNTSMNLMVEGHDCGTPHGISLPISENDVHDRYLAHDFKSGHLHIPRNTLLTPDLVGQIRSIDKNARVIVRSPLKCQMPKGLCQMDVGPSITGQPHELGTNIGVISAQAVGERAVQLTLKSFHTGGVQESGGGAKILNQFVRFEQLTKLPGTIPNAATLAMKSGKIEKIEKDPTGVKVWIGGEAHHVGRDVSGMALHEDLPYTNRGAEGYEAWHPPEVGAHVEAGQLLSDPNRTYVNPHDLFAATKSMEQVQNHLTTKIYNLYKDEGLRRRMIETLVKSMSNLTKVTDPGDHPYLLRGEFYPTSMIKHINETELKGKAIVAHEPVLQGVDMLPLSLQEDWMAKLQHQRLTKTLSSAASMNLSSHIHGSHPIPSLAYGAEFGQPVPTKAIPGKAPAVAKHQY